LLSGEYTLLVANKKQIDYHTGMRLSELLQDELKRSGWSQRQLADEAKVSKATVSRYLSGQRTGESKKLFQVTSALGIDPARVQRALRDEKQEENEAQLIVDLSKVPKEDRPRAREVIDSVMRGFRRKP
jgi:transcriptional regulator with XRE-family HTH domain